MNDLLERNRILNEQYYGKNPLTLDMEKQFEQIQIICRGLQDKTILGSLTPMTPDIMKQISPLTTKIEKDIEELFNFRRASLEIINSGSMNAFTLPGDNIPTVAWAAKENGTYGIKYKNKSRDIIIMFNIELITSPSVTPAMCVAVLLHEIGHNFYYENSVLYYGSKALDALNVYKLLKTQLLKNGLANSDKDASNMAISAAIQTYILNSFVVKELSTYISKLGSNSKISAILKSIIGTYKICYESFDTLRGYYNRLNNFSNIFNNSIFTKLSKLKNPLTIPHAIIAKRNEMFSDNFATMYGYGADTAMIDAKTFVDTYGDSLLDKMTQNSKILTMITEIMFKTSDLIPDITEPHGTHVSRVLDQINYLEKNLQNESLTDKQKKAIVSDLKQVKDVYAQLDEYSKMDGDLVKQGKVITALLIQNDIALTGGISYNLNYDTTDKNGNWKNLL